MLFFFNNINDKYVWINYIKILYRVIVLRLKIFIFLNCSIVIITGLLAIYSYCICTYNIKVPITVNNGNNNIFRGICHICLPHIPADSSYIIIILIFFSKQSTYYRIFINVIFEYNDKIFQFV